jgi:hypothetical protein
VPLKRPSRAGDSVIPRQELMGDRRRADTSYQQLKALRRNTVQWLVAEAGPQAPDCQLLTDELLRLGEKYGVGRDAARANTLQEFFVGILQAIDSLAV